MLCKHSSPAFLLLLISCSFLSHVDSSPPRAYSQNYSIKRSFSSSLYQPIAYNNLNKNFVYSPSSIHTMLALLHGVSTHQTANQLRMVGLFSGVKMSIARDFQRVNAKNQELNGAQLIVTNKVFYNYEYAHLNPYFSQFALNYYGCAIEAVSMRRSDNTADKINDWVSKATGHNIRNLVSPSDVDEKANVMLVSGIYFKARWAREFSAMDTTSEKFRVNNNKVITVSMMFNQAKFRFAKLPELDATALEMAYVGTEATMLFILPNQVEGLAQLERQLANPNNDLNVIASRLRNETVNVRLPKFRIEFKQDMVRPLQQLGLQRIFTPDKSQINSMLTRSVTVSNILQKTFIDVSEAGSDAVAASNKYSKTPLWRQMSLPQNISEFKADHPFMFAIRTPEAVLLIGHVLLPSQSVGMSN